MRSGHWSLGEREEERDREETERKGRGGGGWRVERSLWNPLEDGILTYQCGVKKLHFASQDKV